VVEEQVDEGRLGIDRLAVERGEDISLLKPRLPCRAGGVDLGDQNAVVCAQVVAFG